MARDQRSALATVPNPSYRVAPRGPSHHLHGSRNPCGGNSPDETAPPAPLTAFEAPRSINFDSASLGAPSSRGPNLDNHFRGSARGRLDIDDHGHGLESGIE